jgi:hypothetical protein
MRFSSGVPWETTLRVDKNGRILWGNSRLFISSALAHEDIEIRYESGLEQWHVVFGPLSIGWLRETPAPSFLPTKGRLADLVEREISDNEVLKRKVSGMSPD